MLSPAFLIGVKFRSADGVFAIPVWHCPAFFVNFAD
mgnify:CR=1 FL=1